MWPDIQKYDVLRYNPNHVAGTLDEEAMARAVIKKGYLPSKDPGMAAYLNIVKGLAANMCPGWATMPDGHDNTLFVQGKLAYMWEGSWAADNIQVAAPKGFTYGVTYLPTITSATTSVVHNPPYLPQAIGGLSAHDLAVTKSAVNDGSVNLAVDFLQYCTAPANNAPVVDEIPQFPAAVNGVANPPGIDFSAFEKDFNQLVKGRDSVAPASLLSDSDPNSLWTSKFSEIQVEYMQGQISLPSALSQLDSLAQEAAAFDVVANDKTKAKGGTWDLTKW